MAEIHFDPKRCILQSTVAIVSNRPRRQCRMNIIKQINSVIIVIALVQVIRVCIHCSLTGVQNVIVQRVPDEEVSGEEFTRLIRKIGRKVFPGETVYRFCQKVQSYSRFEARTLG